MARNFKCFCKEPEKIENYEIAAADNFKGWDCHHRLQTWTSDGERRLVDISAAELISLGMYYDRPASELIFLTKSEHKALHEKGKPKSAEHKKKISDALKGKPKSEEAKKKMSEVWDYDKHFTEEAKKKMSDAQKGNINVRGKHWYNNGKICVMAKECPEGFVPGRVK